MFRIGRFRSESSIDSNPQEESESGADFAPGQGTSLPLHPRPTLHKSATASSSASVFSTRPEAQGTAVDPLGLQIVYQTNRPIGDLVFVHGLGGSAWKTWTWSSRDSDSFWPHWLPDDDDLLADFRISTFGYNAKFKGSATNLDIIDFAKDLLFQLATILGVDHDDHQRPLIFVVHSMGGLVVKKAYTLGKYDKQYSDLISRVRGMVFLSTPHRGTQYAKTLNNILSAAPMGISPKAYVAGLGLQSSAIQDINESFRQHCEGLLLCSFHETLKTSVGLTKVLIVEKESAILGYPSEISAGMDADHQTICKYRDITDPNFLKVKGVLRSWAAQTVQEIPEPPMSYHEDIFDPISPDLRIQQILGIDNSIDDLPVMDRGSTPPNSGDWLYQRPEFEQWVGSKHEPVFMLLGLPGAGKSVISLSTIEYLKSLGHDVHYHFFNETHQVTKTAAYCLRRLASQIATSNPEFRDALFQFHERTGASFTTSSHTFQSIWDRLFEGILFQLHSIKPIFWVLDGVDESDAPSLLTSRITAIQSLTPIRIFISSRPLKALPSAELANMKTYTLQPSDTSRDMQKYVSVAVSRALPDDEVLQNFVREEILKKAAGSFLWAKLALDMLQDSWHTQDDIVAALTEVPQGMTAMYTRMVNTIDEQGARNGQLAKHVLSWVACSWRPLYLTELGDALKPEFGVFTNLALTVTTICGHFITLDESDPNGTTATLIHITAREFLLRHRDDGGSWIEPRQAHERIAKSLLGYLCNDLWRKHFSSSEVITGSGYNAPVAENVNRLEIASKSYPLLSYATYHWAYHLSKSKSHDADLMELLENFMLNYCLSWIEGISLSGNMARLIKSAQYLRAYIKKSTRSGFNDTQWLQLWTTDFIRIAGKFAGNLVLSPSSVYRNIPAMCPKKSMIGKTFGTPRMGSLSVSGLPMETWDDCLASIATSDDEYANQVLANESYFFTLSSSSGNISLWNISTCDHVRSLAHEEYVSRMTLSKTGAFLAAAGFAHYFVWESSSGKLRHRIPRGTDAMVRDLCFGTGEAELIVALDNCTMQFIGLSSPSITRTVEADLSELEVGYKGCPWREAISPDFTKVAMAWRGRPPLVWDFRSTARTSPLKCRTKGPTDPLVYSERLIWRPDTGSLLILCNDTSLFEWRVFEDELVDFTHVKARDMAISNDGNLLLSADHNGKINIWSFPNLNLIYTLVSSGDSVTDMVFAPDNQRFYDIRNSNCNVWEPDALIRTDDNDHEDSSSNTGSYATTEAVTSTSTSQNATITAMAVGPTDECFVCGREDGSVIIHDAVDGKRLRKVLTHPASSAVISLAWSKSGKYMASCDESALLVIKRLQLKEDGKWAVFPVSDIRLEEPVRQLLFCPHEKHFLIATSRKDRVWDLSRKTEVHATSRDPHHRHWILDPTNSSCLLRVGAEGGVQACSWSTEEETKQAAEPVASATLDTVTKGHSTVVRAFPIDDQHQILAISNEERPFAAQFHVGLTLQLLCCSTSDPHRIPLPPKITSKIKLLLGTFTHNLLFLGLDGWIFSYDITTLLTSPHARDGQRGSQQEQGLRRHFYLPKDWLNNVASHLAIVNEAGTFFFSPKQGDVAIVRNGLRL